MAGRTRGYPSDTAAASTTPRSFNDNTYVIGMSTDNYYYPGRVSSFSVSDNAVTITGTGSSYGISFPTDKLQAGKFYRIKKCVANGNFSCAVTFYGGGHGQNSNRYISHSRSGSNFNSVFQVPTYTTQTIIDFMFWQDSLQTISLTDFQLEEVAFQYGV